MTTEATADYRAGFYAAKAIIAEVVEGWLNSQPFLKPIIKERPICDILMIINSVELKRKEPSNEC